MSESSGQKVWERIFCPKTLAVLGVSASKLISFGSMFVKANLDSGYQGKIYPVGSSGGEIYGLKIYQGLDQIPGPVDLACIAVPAQSILSALEECLNKGVAGAQILTAGFGELGTEEGRKIESGIAAFGKKGLRIIGPNCFGIHCPYCGLTILPGGGFSKKPGDVAFFGQSGGMAVDLGYSAPGLGLGWRRMVSYGNACDVDAAELLELFADDPQCAVITGYVEGVRDGQKFLRALKSASLKKPVVLWKAGLTESGSRAVMSHTGSMGGEGAIWKSALKQAGAVLVSGQEEMLDTVLAFQHLGEWTGRGFAVVGGGGALGVASADTAEEFGFCLPEFSESTRSQIQKLLPSVGTSLKNPADVGNPMVPPEILGKIMECSASDENIDAILLIQIIHHITWTTRLQFGNPGQPLAGMSWHQKLAEICNEIRQKTRVPVIQILPPISSEPEKMEVENVLRLARQASHGLGIPTYPNLKRAISALANLNNYWRGRKAKM